MILHTHRARRLRARSAALHRVAPSGSRLARPAPSERSNQVFLFLLYTAFALGALFFLGVVYAIFTGDLPALAP